MYGAFGDSQAKSDPGGDTRPRYKGSHEADANGRFYDSHDRNTGRELSGQVDEGGQKPPLRLKEIWAIRIRLQLHHRARERALFNLAIDIKLPGWDLVGRYDARTYTH